MPFDGAYIENGIPNLEKIREVSARNLKTSTIDVADTIGAKLAEDVDTDRTAEDFRNAVRLAKKQGISYNHIVQFAGLVKSAKSYTWHPTKGLNAEGTRLQLELIAAYQLPVDIRAQAVKTAKENLLNSTDITPSQKDTMIDEIDANIAIANRDNEGANITERAFEDVIEAEYGTRPDLSINLGGRTWIFDADGKNNNESWAMIAANMTLKKAMVQQVLDALNTEFADYNIDLVDLRDDLEDVMKNIDKLYNKSRSMVLKLAELPVEDRPKFYEDHYPQLQDAMEDLRSLYEVVGDKEGRGHNFYKKTLETLNTARKNPALDPKIDNAYRILRRNGFMLQRGQTRHNGIVYQDIIKNLFESEEFLQSEFLTDKDRKLIKKRGGFKNLEDEVQQRIMKDATKGTSDFDTRQRLQKYLEDANPLAFDEKNGYPKPERALLNRLRVRTITKRNYAEGIISDSAKFSASEEHFLAKIYGMPGMKHMMLNEDPETLSMQDKLAILFNTHGGAEGAEFRHNNLDLVYKRGPDNEIRIMIPSSDSMRNGGPGTLMQMCNTIREATLAGIEMGVPVEIMLGSGGSMGRFGCDQAMVRRIVAQTLQEHAIERGRAYDPRDPKDAAALRMAMVVMHTEQGRMPDIMSATPEQVAKTNISRITEMLEDHIELTGLVEVGTFIDQRPALKPSMQEKADRRWKEMIEEFRDLRFAVSSKHKDEKGNTVPILNSLARKVMCPNMRPYMNNGARPAAKGSGKEVLDVRAIENDEAKAVAEIFDSSFYASGLMMEELHRTANSNKSSQDRNITAHDVHDHLSQPDWNFFTFGKGVTEAKRFEAARKFEKLSGPGQWDFDRVVAIGKSVNLEKLDPENKDKDKRAVCIIHFDDQDGTVTEEEAYLAKIYYDRLQFLALTEATLKKELNRDVNDIINDFRPADGDLEFGPGEETMREWPVAQTVYDNHRKNDEALGLIHELEDYFQYRLDEGATKEEIEEELGGEALLRQCASAWRAGTLAHTPYWTGEYNYGLENRLETRYKLANENIPVSTNQDFEDHPAVFA